MREGTIKGGEEEEEVEVDLLVGAGGDDKVRKLTRGFSNYLKSIDHTILGKNMMNRVGSLSDARHCMLKEEEIEELLNRLYYSLSSENGVGPPSDRNLGFKVIAGKMSFETLIFFLAHVIPGELPWEERLAKAVACSILISRIILNMYLTGSRAVGNMRSKVFTEIKEGLEDGVERAILRLTGRDASVKIITGGNNAFKEVEISVPGIGLRKTVRLSSRGRGSRARRGRPSPRIKPEV